MTLVVIPSSQPSEAWLVPMSQLSFTWRVLATASAITITRSAISANAEA